jgi:Family of unknown function (DUF5343)
LGIIYTSDQKGGEVMAQDYPYMISNNKIDPILHKVEQAEKPPRFTNEFLKKLGFSSSNDRAIIPLLKRLGFLNESSVPTEYYDDLKDKTKRSYVLGERIRALYSDLYSINTNIHDAPDEEIKGAISRVTGKDAKAVNRFFATLKTLIGLAKFTPPPQKKKEEDKQQQDVQKQELGAPKKEQTSHPSFHYNIQVHLPATTDIGVYNAIFKSLKDNLLI